MEEESVVSKKQEQRQRNINNNANNIRAAADIASKTNNPYAKAIGEGVKIADKISGGKSSEMLGKHLDRVNRLNGLQGKMVQSALNKMSESGTSDRIASAMSAKNGGKNVPKNGTSKPQKNANANSKAASSIKDKSQENSSDTAEATFGGSFKVVKYGLIGVAALMPVIFCVLFISSSQIYVNAIDLGTADSLSSEEAEEKINKKGTEGLDEEKTDDDVAYDVYINDEKAIFLRNSKLENVNIIQVSQTKTYLKRKYNEADLDELEDFYPSVTDLSKNYDENMVYDFFFKMYNLYKTYRDEYNVYLDLPLLMSTLNLQSSDKNVIFSANLGEEDRMSTARQMPIAEFDYYYDWSVSGYKITKNNSEHDMEILAQHMVSKQVKEKCLDSLGKVINENILRDNEIGTQTLICSEGETYQTEELGFVIDNQKYRQFLKQFLEKKYYLEDGGYVEYSNIPKTQNNGLSCSGHNSFIKYNLTDDQLLQIASLAQQEQGTAKGAAAEASLMANLFEINGSKYGSGADGLYNYVRNSGWFANSTKFMDGRAARTEVIDAVRNVLINGKRTLPVYIDEHDYLGDIISVTNSGSSILKTEKGSYIKFNTIIKNRMGSTYTFYSFPDTNSDPFGYTSESRRKEKGEFHYDYDTGNPVYCSGENGTTSLNTSPAAGNYKEWKQCNESWSDKTVPNSSSTMCKIGCLITSVTKQIVRSETAITTDWLDPGIAMDKFEFIKGGKFVWDSAKNIAPNFRYYTDINLVGMTQKSVAQKLASYDASRYYIILAVSKKDRDKVHHYVALDYIDLSNNKIYIMDSSTESYTDLYAGYKVYQAHLYEKRD